GAADVGRHPEAVAGGRSPHLHEVGRTSAPRGRERIATESPRVRARGLFSWLRRPAPDGDAMKEQEARERAVPALLAVIDIGSNSGRGVVYRHQGEGHMQILAGRRASLHRVRELVPTPRPRAHTVERALDALPRLR